VEQVGTQLDLEELEKVISCDLDSLILRIARHNASVYSVIDGIEFLGGNFFDISGLIQADVVFLSPPWGGPNYINKNFFDLNIDMASACLGKNFRHMIQAANRSLRFPLTHLSKKKEFSSCNNFGIIVYLPKNINLDQLVKICLDEFPSLVNLRPGIEFELNQINGKLKAITVYLGRFQIARAMRQS